MDISKMPNEKKLSLCKSYFMRKCKWKTISVKTPNDSTKKVCKLINALFAEFSVGFLFLPFIWAINSVWFYSDAFLKPAYEEQKTIRRCKWFGDQSNPPISWYILMNLCCACFRCDILCNWGADMGHWPCYMVCYIPVESCGLGRVRWFH